MVCPRITFHCMFLLAITCTAGPLAGANWQTELNSALPLLGHRNWVAVVDSAYPLQTAPGVKMVYVGG
ncbi:MAG: hypothetical protein KDA60_17790, partial [Planctomycetales bacterium]|nr:hypothetical protein [Planctomycetales bacterium]